MTGPVETALTEKLTNAFKPTHLEVINQSHLHAGHASSPGTGESHFRVIVRAPAFAGASRVEAQRMVLSVMASELAGPLHALSIDAKAE